MCSKLFDRYSQPVKGTVFTSLHCSAVIYGEAKINVFLRRTSSHSEETDYFTSHLGGFPPDLQFKTLMDQPPAPSIPLIAIWTPLGISAWEFSAKDVYMLNLRGLGQEVRCVGHQSGSDWS